MAKSIVIVGAGIAGLAAGCYARMNGYDTLILEMHDKPGVCAPPGTAGATPSMAVCTTW